GGEESAGRDEELLPLPRAGGEVDAKRTERGCFTIPLPYDGGNMDTGLTTIAEADVEKHRATAQSFVTRMVVLEDGTGQSQTALAGTGRRFVSTVATGAVR